MSWISPAPPPVKAWTEIFRRAPIGVLVLGALLFFVGAGFILAGVFFLLLGTVGIPFGGVIMLLVGPLFLYVALQLVLLQRWAWLAIVALLALLLVSSLIRAFTAEEIPIAPLFEVVVQLGTLAYLTRPRVRGAFAAD